MTSGDPISRHFTSLPAKPTSSFPFSIGENERRYIMAMLQPKQMNIHSTKEEFVAELTKTTIREAIQDAIDKGSHFARSF